MRLVGQDVAVEGVGDVAHPTNRWSPSAIARRRVTGVPTLMSVTTWRARSPRRSRAGGTRRRRAGSAWRRTFLVYEALPAGRHPRHRRRGRGIGEEGALRLGGRPGFEQGAEIAVEPVRPAEDPHGLDLREAGEPRRLEIGAQAVARLISRCVAAVGSGVRPKRRRIAARSRVSTAL